MIRLQGPGKERRAEQWREALRLFQPVLEQAEKNGDDSLAFYCHYKSAVILFHLDSFSTAGNHFLEALDLKEKPGIIHDSAWFRMLLSDGDGFYTRGMPDATGLFYEKAEELAKGIKTDPGKLLELYQRLSYLYTGAGKYGKATAVLQKSLDLFSTADERVAVFKTRMADGLMKLERYQEARKLYEELLVLLPGDPLILQQLGTIFLNNDQPVEAIRYFREAMKRTIPTCTLLTKTGKAWLDAGMPDSAGHFFDLAHAEAGHLHAWQQPEARGLIYLYQGEKARKEKKTKEAIAFYQKALGQLSGNERDTGFRENPKNFSGPFPYVHIFNTLAVKADALQQLYYLEKDITTLEAALDSWRAAFELAEYVERTYDSDEARIFLGKIKTMVHGKPIDVSLELYELTLKKNYLEDAWFFDQRNKASLFALNNRENEWLGQLEIKHELLARKSSLKSAITRLAIQTRVVEDSAVRQQLTDSIRRYEKELRDTRELISGDPVLKLKKSFETIPKVREVQAMLDSRTALLSYHLSGDELLTLLITAHEFEYNRSAINRNFFQAIESFKHALAGVPADQHYSGSAAAFTLYQSLISPLWNKLSRARRLVIIPDDELNYLPFEALEDGNQDYLAEKFAIQYHFSAALLEKDKERISFKPALSFAPFASTTYRDADGNTLHNLPYSREEIHGTDGDILLDSAATRERFIRSVNHFPLLHLATHAQLDNTDPARSFIAFFPGEPDFRLSVRDLYTLRMDSTNLVIISACQAAGGRQEIGEGLMSLSRAFAYAGCPNIITSLWKSEGKPTSFMLQRFHHYLGRGYSKDISLQYARLDLLNSPDIHPRFKSPPLWAHLVFYGYYEQGHTRSDWRWVTIGILAILLGYYFIKRRMG